MAKVTPITEQFQHFVQDLKESFWGDVYDKTRGLWKKFLEEESRRQQASYLGLERHERAEEERKDYRNGFYQRDLVTRLGTLRLSIARTRKKSFLPALLERFQRRAEEVMLLIREAFLRGISTRQVGRVAGGAYVLTLFVGMYAPLGMSMPSQHFVQPQDRTLIPEIEPPTRPRPVGQVLDQASFHGIVLHVIQFLISLLGAPDVHVVEPTRTIYRPCGAYIPTKRSCEKIKKIEKLRNFLVLAIQL